ncbi:MAG: lipocalin family protein [Bacteroidales bacterium]|jgi:hypothetical protein|nr:lipocalin family protein [Bacteroidales bacterium]
MKVFTKFMAFALISVFIMSSCGKYEDGPAISLLPKTMRLQKQWKLDERYVDGVAQTLTTDDKDDYFEFKKDGVYDYTTVIGSASVVTQTGTWALINSKETIEVSALIGTISYNTEYTILRLTSKELWVEFENTLGQNEEDHLVVR